MIESKEQVLVAFRNAADTFFDDPGLVSGIDLDDATVTLKRYVLSEMHNIELGSRLAGVPKLIRQLDLDALRREVPEIAAAVEAG